MQLSLKNIIQTYFPHPCLLCDLPCDHSTLICKSCFETLPVTKMACKQCGLCVPKTELNTLCGECLSNPPPFDRTIALFQYQSPISNLIWKLKFQGDLSIAQLFSKYWIAFIPSRYLSQSLPDLIIPVPLHHKRLKQRGFNQALLIAKPIGKQFHIPVDTRSCIRIKNTRAQSTLTASKRKHNMKNAFGLSHPLSAKHVAILDDVMTTGNTVSEISYLLKKSGVEQIDVWCCARMQH